MASEKVYNFNTIFETREYYEEIKNELKEQILADFSSRNKPAKIFIGNKVTDATLGRVLTNLLLMKSLVGTGYKVVDHTDLYDYPSVTESNLAKYFNRLLEKCRNDVGTDYEEIRQLVFDTLCELADLSGELNVLAGNTVSFHDFVRLYSEDDSEFKELLNQKLPEVVQFDEIERIFNELGTRIENFFLKRTDTELHPFVLSGTGINKKQFTQAIGIIGLKPDIDGNVIPVPIGDNYTKGLSNLENYFINAKGTRKALITNSKMVRKSGYLTRKLSLALVDRYHDNDLHDCGTTHFLRYNVDHPKKIGMIAGQHYYDINDNGEAQAELKTVGKNDLFLLGKTIALRSPITCAGKHVCKTCYGSELSEINRDLNTGLVAVLLLTNPLTQRLLSAKHLLTTNTDKVNWGDKFLEFFSVHMNQIFLNDPDHSVIIDKKTIIMDDEDEDLPYTEKIAVYIGNKKLFDFNSPLKLFLDEDAIRMCSDDAEETVIKLEGNMFREEPVFTFIVKNNELTKSLQQILDLIESSGHLEVETYDEMASLFDSLLIENGMNFIKSVHAQMIASVLVREKETEKKLDFSKKQLDDYKLVRVSKAVMNAPLSVSLAFERINEQLIDLNTYLKDEESLMDYLYG
jgi:hypothetical protein